MAKKTTTKLSTGAIIGISTLAFLVLVLLWIGGTYNGLVRLDENANTKWANVEADYQRRADLIPNLVATVQQYTDYEGSVLTEITAARSAWQSAGSPESRQAAAGEMDSALARLLVVVENYPNLKANENYLSLQDELAGTENRIKLSRTQFNEAVQQYNQRVRVFPANIVAGMFGFERKDLFEATEGSEVAPNVDDLFA
jgi:LemA protein